MFDYTNKSVKDSFREIQDSLISNFGTTNVGGKLVKDSDEGMFLSNALERIDPFIHKPLMRFYWSGAMPILYGGGAVEFASFFRINYNSYDANKNVTSGSNNIITTVKVAIQKFQTMVKAYAWKIGIGWIDELKYRQIGSDILTQLDEGVRAYYNQKLDDIAFFGFVKEGAEDAYGLANNANVTAIESDVQFDAAGTTPLQIVNAINGLLASIASRSEYNVVYRTNHLLLPPSVYTAMIQPMTIGGQNGAIYTNVMEYFKATNYVKALYGNDDLVILPIPYLETAATGNKKRAIAYCYDEACVRMPLPMDLTRGATMFNPTEMETQTPFVTFIGQPQFVYLSTIGYLDNI